MDYFRFVPAWRVIRVPHVQEESVLLVSQFETSLVFAQASFQSA